MFKKNTTVTRELHDWITDLKTEYWYSEGDTTIKLRHKIIKLMRIMERWEWGL